MSALVRTVESRSGAWRRIVLGGPRGHLLSLDMVRALDAVIHAAESARGVKWLTIEGKGGEFSYGARIQEHVPELMPTVLPETHRIIRRLLAFPAPTAALVEGRCLGGGFELALACDDIIATESSTFGLPEIRLCAFAPAAAALLPLRVGASRATRAIVTGQIQDARYWHEAGLCSIVGPQASLIEAAADWFNAHLSPRSSVALSHAVAAARLTLRAQAEPALDAAERDYLQGLLKTADAVEGVQAWLEKAAPELEESVESANMIDCDVWVRGQQDASTRRIEGVPEDPAAWTDLDVRALLEQMLLALDRARNPAGERPPVTLRGFSWIVSAEAAGVLVHLELQTGTVSAGPFRIDEARLTDMIARIMNSPQPSTLVH